MTKERFEEFVEIGLKIRLGSFFYETFSIETKDAYRGEIRDTIRAVYPLIRDEVIDECERLAIIPSETIPSNCMCKGGAKRGAYCAEHTAKNISYAIRDLKLKESKL